MAAGPETTHPNFTEVVAAAEDYVAGLYVEEFSYQPEPVAEFLSLLTNSHELPAAIANTDMADFVRQVLVAQVAVRKQNRVVARKDVQVIHLQLQGISNHDIVEIVHDSTWLEISTRHNDIARYAQVQDKVAMMMHKIPGYTPQAMLGMIENYVAGEEHVVPLLEPDMPSTSRFVDKLPPHKPTDHPQDRLQRWLRLGFGKTVPQKELLLLGRHLLGETAPTRPPLPQGVFKMLLEKIEIARNTAVKAFVTPEFRSALVFHPDEAEMLRNLVTAEGDKTKSGYPELAQGKTAQEKNLLNDQIILAVGRIMVLPTDDIIRDQTARSN